MGTSGQVCTGTRRHNHAHRRVRRREFITLLGGAAVGWPLAATPQTQPKIPRVGVVQAATPARGLEAFRQGLRELGYAEGQTIILELRSAEGRLERIPELVAELVSLKVDVLVAGGTPAILAVSNATQTIPIVMVGGNPVRLRPAPKPSATGGTGTRSRYRCKEN